MGDRRPSFFRSLLSSTSGSRRRPAGRTTAPPRPPESQNVATTSSPTPTETTTPAPVAAPSKKQDEPSSPSHANTPSPPPPPPSSPSQPRSPSPSPSRLPKAATTKGVKPVSPSRIPSQQISISHQAPNSIPQNKAAGIIHGDADAQPSPSSRVAPDPETTHTPKSSDANKALLQSDEKPEDIKQVVKEQTQSNAQMKKETIEPKTDMKWARDKLANATTHPPKDDISNFIKQMSFGDPKSDKQVSVITLAGDNRGASMQMGSTSSKIPIHRGYKISPAESTTVAARDGDRTSDDESAAEDQPQAYVNNNAQGVNNSIIFNSSITERNPGVHMVVSHVPKELAAAVPADKAEARRAEFNFTRTENLTYEPTVRRRCLRGLFLEPSDSDDDPEKPRRHGCRVACQGST